MRASEFISESEFQQLHEKGFWKGLGSAAANFGHGAGLISGSDFAKIQDKLNPSQMADNVAETLKGQLKRIDSMAKKKGISSESDEYKRAVESAVRSLFQEGLGMDGEIPQIAKAIDAVVKVATTGGNIDSAVKKVVEPMMKIKKQGMGGTPFKAENIPGPDTENNPSVFIKVGNKFEKYEDKVGNGMYKKVNIPANSDVEVDPKDARPGNFIRVDKDTIRWADERQNDALQQDAKNDARQDAQNDRDIKEIASEIIAQLEDVPAEDRNETVQDLITDAKAQRGLEADHINKLKELIQKGLDTTADEEPAHEPGDVSSFVAQAIAHINDNPGLYLTGVDRDDAEAIRSMVSSNAEKFGIPAEQVDTVANQIITQVDPGMLEPTPGSADRLEKFSADVFFPQGKKYDGNSLAYANNNGRWSQWRLAKSGMWEFERDITSPENIKRLEQSVVDNELKPRPMEFKHTKDDYYKVT